MQSAYSSLPGVLVAPPGRLLSLSFGEGAALWLAPELSDPVSPVKVGEHEDVEQLGAGSGTEGIKAFMQSGSSSSDASESEPVSEVGTGEAIRLSSKVTTDTAGGATVALACAGQADHHREGRACVQA